MKTLKNIADVTFWRPQHQLWPNKSAIVEFSRLIQGYFLLHACNPFFSFFFSFVPLALSDACTNCICGKGRWNHNF